MIVTIKGIEFSYPLNLIKNLYKNKKGFPARKLRSLER